MLEYKDVIALLITGFSYLIGGWDTTLRVLLILMSLDVISGMYKAWIMGIFQSKEFRQGLLTKSGFFLVLILAYQMDLMMGNAEPVIRTITAMFYIGVEGTSLLENLGAIGVPIPKFIRKRLKVFQDNADEGAQIQEQSA